MDFEQLQFELMVMLGSRAHRYDVATAARRFVGSHRITEVAQIDSGDMMCLMVELARHATGSHETGVTVYDVMTDIVLGQLVPSSGYSADGHTITMGTNEMSDRLHKLLSRAMITPLSVFAIGRYGLHIGVAGPDCS